MKPLALLASAAGLCLVAAPSQAQPTYLLTSIAPSFTSTLTNLTGTGLVDIFATDDGAAPGQQYAAGTFAYNGSTFSINDLTVDPTVTPPGGASEFDITPQLALDGLSLTENLAGGGTAPLNVSLFDANNPGVATTNADPLDFATDANGNFLSDVNGNFIPLSGFLTSAPVTLPSNVTSVTLSGTFTDNYTPAGTPIGVKVAVPEPGDTALLLIGLAALLPVMGRIRKARLSS